MEDERRPRTGTARDSGAHQGQFRAPGLDAASRRTARTRGARTRPHRVAQWPEVNQQHGYIHAGATSAIADSAGGYAAFTLFPEDTAVLTVEYKINFLAPAVGDHIEALGTVLKSGRTLTVCQLDEPSPCAN
jgi:Thioesterase superfamily